MTILKILVRVDPSQIIFWWFNTIRVFLKQELILKLFELLSTINNLRIILGNIIRHKLLLLMIIILFIDSRINFAVNILVKITLLIMLFEINEALLILFIFHYDVIYWYILILIFIIPFVVFVIYFSSWPIALKQIAWIITFIIFLFNVTWQYVNV